jgi:glycosyltransferase involved in cell wall biosynthesis
MITQPLVSIIIPNYNNEKYLEQCLNSVLNQSYQNLEIIVVDDFSSDNSVAIIVKLATAHPSIRLITNTSNKGVARSRHDGFLAARGSLFCTLDSDDFYFSPRKIEREVRVVLSQPDWKHAIGFSNVVLVDAKSWFIARTMNRFSACEGHVFELFLTRGCPMPRDFVFARDLYFAAGGLSFNFPIYEDWDLKIRLSRMATFHFTNCDGVAYRQHELGLSSVSSAENLDWITRVFDHNATDLENRDALFERLNRNLHTSLFRLFLRKVRKNARLFLLRVIKE